MHAKKIIFGIQLHAVVKALNIQKKGDSLIIHDEIIKDEAKAVPKRFNENN